jgi:tRNA-specific 2-thiouridylase
MKPKAAIAISGGIDSLAAAFLLKKKYHHVVGLHFVNGYESSPAFQHCLPAHPDGEETGPQASIYNPAPDHPLYSVQKQLDIPIHLIDVRNYFQKTVVDYFVENYMCGRTPNPCLLCNPSVKFGILFDLAKQIGAEYFATGHYVRIHQEDGRFFLQKGIDPAKDQSYFLAMVPGRVLPHLRFPLGAMTKQATMQLAAEHNLTPVSHKESQDICFIRDNDYARFISACKETAGSPGIITDTRGNDIGTHNGLHHFTIGQRRGINCPASQPYYVIKIDARGNRLIVGAKKDLYKTGLRMRHINWFIQKPVTPLTVFVKIRYRHPAAEATLFPPEGDEAVIRFKSPQQAITPGQGAVCYVNDNVIAGGWIDE